MTKDSGCPVSCGAFVAPGSAHWKNIGPIFQESFQSFRFRIRTSRFIIRIFIHSDSNLQNLIRFLPFPSVHLSIFPVSPVRSSRQESYSAPVDFKIQDSTENPQKIHGNSHLLIRLFEYSQVSSRH